MGMFDEIRCRMALEGIADKEIVYQTKDLENTLEEFEIREDGTLWLNKKDYKWCEDPTRPIFKGYLKVVKSEWVPYLYTGALDFYDDNVMVSCLFREGVCRATQVTIDRQNTPDPAHVQDTRDHIKTVRELLDGICRLIGLRATVHDSSKLVEPELSGYAALHAELAPLAFGTPEYWAAVERHRPTVEHHFAHNSHHPEYYPNGIDDMDLLDIIEMLADWKAASERPTSLTSFADGFEHNCDRFRVSPQLKGIMRSTANRLRWL